MSKRTNGMGFTADVSGISDPYEYDQFENLYSYFGGVKSKQMPDNFVFDPKNPPLTGCTNYHPPLKLKIEDKNVEIYGSSCLNPIIKDADLYISLDNFAPAYEWENPWETSDKKHVRLFITDGSTPENIDKFNQGLKYTINALAEGKKVHVGCIAGHGRTGIFLAALTQLTIGKELNEKSAIDYVRETYCDNAVENLRQVLFLTSVYGISTPIREQEDMSEFENEFKKEIGLEFNEVVSKSGFNSTVKIIKEIDNKLFGYYSSNKKNKWNNTWNNQSSINTPSSLINSKTSMFKSDLPLEPNGTIAMGNDPDEKRSFSRRLDPDKLAKLQKFKLKRY